MLPYLGLVLGGTGLGLALVRQTIEVHGGTVTVEENGGGGSVFVFRIPRSTS